MNPEPSGKTTLTLVVDQVPRDVRLLDAGIGNRGESPCLTPMEPRVGRERGRPADAPLEPGERLVLGFSSVDFWSLDDDSARLDLVLQTPQKNLRCVAFPLADEARLRPLPWKPVKHVMMGTGLLVEGFTARLGSVTHIFGFPFAVGLWLGDYRIEVSGGYYGAGCPDTLCPVTSKDDHFRYSTVFPFAAGLTRVLGEYRRDSGALYAAVTARYRVVNLAADTFNGREQIWMHGPVLAPYVGASSSFGMPEMTIGFEFPVGYAFAENGDSTVTLGFGLIILTEF